MAQVHKNRKAFFSMIKGVALGLLCFTVIDILLMIGWYGASGTVLDTGWTVEETGETVDIPHIEIVREDGTFTLTNTFEMDAEGDYGLVIPYPSGTAFAAHINGEEIGASGKLGDSTSNMWYTSFVFPAESIRAGENEITIQVYGLYDVGFLTPPYIEDYDTAVSKVYWSGKVRNNLLLVVSGISLAFGLLLLIAFFKNRRKDKAVLFAAITGILVYFVAVDCVFDVGAGSVLQLLLLKKSRFVILFASIACVATTLHYNKGGKGKAMPIAIWASAAAGFVPIAVSQSFYEWYTWMWICFVFVGVIVALMYYLALSTKRNRMVNVMMCVIVTLTFLQGLLSNLAGLNVPSPLQFAFVSVSLLIGMIYTSKLNEIYNEKRYLEDVSKRDMLTGAYNRRMIELAGGSEGDCVVLMDIDRFKSVNDNHGHEAGDEVLKELVRLALQATRKADVFIRLGGDEFGLLLKDCPMDRAEQKMKTLARLFRARFLEYDIAISYGLVMFADTFEKSIGRADEAMYVMKQAGKSG